MHYNYAEILHSAIFRPFKPPIETIKKFFRNFFIFTKLLLYIFSNFVNHLPFKTAISPGISRLSTKYMDKTETIDHIDHSAVVIGTDPARNIVQVRIDDSGECGSCPAAAVCGGYIDPDNVVSIITGNAAEYRKNDIVTVRGTERMHRKAIMYATVIPCVILVAVMMAVFIITGNQLAAAISGIGTMILFFVILWAARNKIAHEFTFEIVGPIERAGDHNQTMQK